MVIYSILVMVDILDKNEVPEIVNLPASTAVWEDAAGFTNLYSVATTDVENDVISHYISVSPAHANSFGIDNASKCK